MSDLSIAWTSGLSSFSYTCELKAAGCTDPYEGFFISMVENKIYGAQNVLEGWKEEVCVKCTDSKGVVIQKDDNMVLS